MVGHEGGSRVVSDSLHDSCNADFPFWERALAESGPSKSPDFNQGCCCQKLSFACFFGSVMLIEFGRVAGVCWGWCDAAFKPILMKSKGAHKVFCEWNGSSVVSHERIFSYFGCRQT